MKNKEILQQCKSNIGFIINTLKILAIVKSWHNYFIDYTTLDRNKKINQLILWNGIRYFIRPKTTDMQIFNEVYLYKEYTPKNFDIYPNDNIIDIGSHIGIFSIYAAKKAYKGKVYAFEPISSNYSILKKNISLNSIKNIIIENKGISNKRGKKKIYINKDPGGNSSYIYKNGDKNIISNMTTLQRIIKENNISKVNLLKIDCEGAEYDILLNCPDNIFLKIERISLEYHFFKDKNPKILANFLRKKGYIVNHVRWPYPMMYARRPA
jgi:FkbM family methyltransferase